MYKCGTCENYFGSIYELNQHQKQCGKSATSTRQIKLHCHYCIKTFSSKLDLECHLKTHDIRNLDILLNHTNPYKGKNIVNNRNIVRLTDSLTWEIINSNIYNMICIPEFVVKYTNYHNPIFICADGDSKDINITSTCQVGAPVISSLIAARQLKSLLPLNYYDCIIMVVCYSYTSPIAKIFKSAMNNLPCFCNEGIVYSQVTNKNFGVAPGQEWHLI
jgi:hypothetical protein